MPSVAFLGPLGTYSHQAVLDTFGHNVNFSPQMTILEVFTVILNGTMPYGMVPIENSSNGPVKETAHALESSKSLLNVSQRFPIKVDHALMRKVNATGELRGVCSHEQALGQCANYLKTNYPNIERLPIASTALAAKMAKDDDSLLAICSIICSEAYGLEVIEKRIQDGGQSNRTEFVIITLLDREPIPPTDVA